MFYYDRDTSWDVENEVIYKAKELFADISVEVQILNEARVQLRYRQKFGIPFGPVTQASDGIDRLNPPCTTSTIGIGCQKNQQFEVYAPFAPTPLFEGTLRPNRALPISTVYAGKTTRWKREWPYLQIEP